MQYKTIVLHLLEQRPELYQQLRNNRMLLPTLERHASQLKTRHETWKEQLWKAKPGSDSHQIASEALEFALQELENALPPEFPPDGNEPISLDGVMAFLCRHTPPA